MPQLSIAVHTLVKDPLLLQAAKKMSLEFIVTSLHMSLPIAEPKSKGNVESPQSIVTSAGQVILGVEVSSNLISPVQTEVFPQLSVAVKVIIKPPPPASLKERNEL